MNDTLPRAELWLFITTLFYFLMNGAQIFETAVLVPKWTASPPANFGLLTDKNGTSLKTFWIVLHSLHEITFTAALVFCWKLDGVRNWMLVFFVAHMIIRIWTLIYFAANIIDFQSTTATAEVSTDLLRRTSLWRTLNYVRVAGFIAISVGLAWLSLHVMDLRSIGTKG